MPVRIPDTARAGLAALAALAAAGCLRSTSFVCERDAQCTGAAGGRCEANGYCSFPDPSCAGGSRFADHAGPASGRCVGDAPADAGLPDPDGPPGPVGCPASYAALPGAGPHVYRALTAAASWQAQRTACAADGGYLVEPGDAAELAAVVALPGVADAWIGVSDQITEGVFVTARGAPAPYLPWDAGEPSNAGGADCVLAKPSARLAADRCGTARPAVCECDP